MALTMADSGNLVVRDFGRNPAVNFNFMLRVEGVFDLPCKAVHSFQRENEYELIQEGGLNDYVHMRRKPVSKPFTFQVERYVGTDILDPLPNGANLTLPVILFINRYRVYGDFVPVRNYVFTGCMVMSKEYGELDAEKSGLLVEKTTIAYREMFCMENVAGSFLTDEPWKFDGTKKKGSGNQSARHPLTGTMGDGEAIKESFKKKAKRWPERKSAVDVGSFLGGNTEKKAEKWMFAGGDQALASGTAQEARVKDASAEAFRGIHGRTAQNSQAAKEVRKADMEKAARRWPKKRNAADVAAFLSGRKGTGKE